MASIYRADQIGSLLRPPELLEARAAYTDGRIDSEQLRFVEDQAILEALEPYADARLAIADALADMKSDHAPGHA